MIKKLSYALLLLLGVAGTAGADTVTWRHAIVEPKSDAGIVMMAGKSDIAGKHGLNIEYVPVKGDALALKALIAGDVDSYEGSPGGAIIAASRGADIKLVGCYWPGLSYGIFSTDKITSVDQLKNGTFAISNPGSLPDLISRGILRKHNIALSGVRFASLGGDADRFRALSQGLVDAAAISTEFVPFAADHQSHLLFDAHQELPNFLRVCTYVSASKISQDRAAVVNFVAAQMDGVRFAMEHKQASIDLTVKTLNLKPTDPRPAYIYDQAIKFNLLDPTMTVPTDKLNWMKQLLIDTRNLSAPVDIANITDTSIRTEALSHRLVK
jgi:NitT/TauT family transport system substrate-binding protein